MTRMGGGEGGSGVAPPHAMVRVAARLRPQQCGRKGPIRRGSSWTGIRGGGHEQRPGIPRSLPGHLSHCLAGAGEDRRIAGPVDQNRRSDRWASFDDGTGMGRRGSSTHNGHPSPVSWGGASEDWASIASSRGTIGRKRGPVRSAARRGMRPDARPKPQCSIPARIATRGGGRGGAPGTSGQATHPTPRTATAAAAAAAAAAARTAAHFSGRSPLPRRCRKRRRATDAEAQRPEARDWAASSPRRAAGSVAGGGAIGRAEQTTSSRRASRRGTKL